MILPPPRPFRATSTELRLWPSILLGSFQGGGHRNLGKKEPKQVHNKHTRPPIDCFQRHLHAGLHSTPCTSFSQRGDILELDGIREQETQPTVRKLEPSSLLADDS